MLTYSAVELWRSNQYISTAEEYKKSAKVQNLVAEINRLSQAIEAGDGALLCDLSVGKTVKEGSPQDTYTMLSTINTQATQLLDDWPSFASAALHVAEVRESREMSGDIDRAITTLYELSEPNKLSAYCYELATVLSESEFLADIAKREGVSALFVGQIENFEGRFKEIEKEVASLNAVPQEVSSHHQEIVDIYASIGPLLRENTQDFVAYSARINEKLLALDVVLQDIRKTAEQLEGLPEQLQIQSAILR
jgi:hypothetical protein